MLKKCSILLLLIININFPVICAENTSGTLSKLEDATFGIDYPNDKFENRLNRLEKNIYGKTKTGSVESRIKNINKDIAGDVIGKEIAPTKDTFLNEEDIVKSDGTENYPILNEIEQKLFLQTFSEKGLRSRIVKIEKKLFNKTFETDDYYTRVERIKAEYYNIHPPIAQNSYTDDYIAQDYSENNLQSFYSSPYQNNYNKNNFEPSSSYSPNDEYELAALEQKFLRNTYPNESVNERLSRLENKVFETDFFYDDAKIRIDRLASVSNAKKGSQRYDNNRFYSKMNTAMQIGSMLLMVLAFIL